MDWRQKETDIWLDWLDSIGCKEYCSTDVKELVHDIYFSKEELQIEDWAHFVQREKLSKVFLELEDPKVMEDELAQSWILERDIRLDEIIGSKPRGYFNER